MSEIQKQPTNEQNETLDAAFADNIELQQNLKPVDAARRVMDMDDDANIPANNNEATGWDMHEAAPKPSQKRINKFVIGASGTAVAAAFITGGLAIANHLVDEAEAKSFGTETTEYTANLGDTLLDVAEQVPGSDTKRSINDVIYHIETDPANLGPLSDGLQSGDKIRVPVSINGAEPIPTVEK
jgi:hypothetical protein